MLEFFALDAGLGLVPEYPVSRVVFFDEPSQAIDANVEVGCSFFDRQDVLFADWNIHMATSWKLQIKKRPSLNERYVPYWFM